MHTKSVKETDWYIENRLTYEKLSNRVEAIITDILDEKGIEHHIINSRTKTISSFSKKISNSKYRNHSDLTDLAGIRVITYVEDSIPHICKIIEENFKIDKENSLDKGKNLGLDKVGYKSVHFVAELPDSRVKLTEYKKFNKLKFEIQIRTILQHSWAEIEHDRNYKFDGRLPSSIQRRFKLLAGLLELADNEFNSISNEIDSYSNEVKSKTELGDLEIPINSTSIKEYFNHKFSNIPQDQINKDILGEDTIEEIINYGIVRLKDLYNITAGNLEANYIEIDQNLTHTGIVRDILLMNDSKRYFDYSYNEDWAFNTTEDEFKIFKKYGISTETIHKRAQSIF